MENTKKKTKKKNMVMTNEDIVRSYREAKDRRAQIKILAELNVCPQALIIEILKDGGVDWRELPRERQKKPKAVDVSASNEVATSSAGTEDGEASSGIVEEALQLLRRELVRTVKNLKEEYEAMMAQYADKIGEIDLILCGQKKG